MQQGELAIGLTGTGTRGSYRLQLSGELDLATTGELETAIAELCADGASEAVLDLDGLTFVDSTGLRAILGARDMCADNGCAFYVTHGRHAVERVFELTGLLESMPFVD
jgi:anti-sigma B factor antagonist